MAVNADVFRAILAMDSYNRGDAGLGLTDTQLGSATVTANSIQQSITGGSFFAQSSDARTASDGVIGSCPGSARH